jgi:ribosomal subunit interface protein
MKYVHIDSSEALNEFVKKQCHALTERISAHPRKYKLKMSVKPESRNKDGQVKSFQVEGSIDINKRKELRASKKGSDIKKVVEQVVQSLEKQMRRHTEKTERSRKTLGKSLKPIREFKWEMSFKSSKLD